MIKQIILIWFSQLWYEDVVLVFNSNEKKSHLISHGPKIIITTVKSFKFITTKVHYGLNKNNPDLVSKHNYFHLFDLSTIKKNPEVVDLRILIDLQELQLPALIIWRCQLFHLRGRDC